MSIKYFERASFKLRKKLYERLAVLLDAHVSITESLDIISSGLKKQDKKIISDIALRVEQGSSFHESLRKSPGFSDEEIHIVSIGEQTGNLSKNLLILASLMTARDILKKKIIGSLMYPAFVLTIALFVVIGIAVFILPSIIPVITSLKADIPISTKILLFSFSLCKSYWLYILILSILLIVVASLLFVFEKTREKLKALPASIPMIKRMHHRHVIWKLLDTISSLLESGLAPEIAFETARNNIQAKHYLLSLETIIIGLKDGIPIGQLFDESKLFSLETVQLITIGERTGTLSNSLKLCADSYKDSLDRFYKRMTDLVGPVTMIFLGLFIGYIALSIITPIYSAAQHVYK